MSVSMTMSKTLVVEPPVPTGDAIGSRAIDGLLLATQLNPTSSAVQTRFSDIMGVVVVAKTEAQPVNNSHYVFAAAVRAAGSDLMYVTFLAPNVTQAARVGLARRIAAGHASVRSLLITEMTIVTGALQLPTELPTPVPLPVTGVVDRDRSVTHLIVGAVVFSVIFAAFVIFWVCKRKTVLPPFHLPGAAPAGQTGQPGQQQQQPQQQQPQQGMRQAPQEPQGHDMQQLQAPQQEPQQPVQYN
jgi:hypothetical protein